MIEWVDDPDDPRVEAYTRLTDVALRRRWEVAHGLFMAESAPVIHRALDAGCKPHSLLVLDRLLGTDGQTDWDEVAGQVTPATQPTPASLPTPADGLIERVGPSVPVYLGTDAVLQRITGFHLHRGVIAAMHRPPPRRLEEVMAAARRLAILEDIVDHTNVGAIFRGAAGLGVDGVLVSPGCADPLYRRSIRVSMGTVFQVPWTRLEPWPRSLGQLRAAGFVIAAMALTADAVPLDAFAATAPERLALLLGTEGDGLSARTLALADIAVQIPMTGGVDSLNVAAAAAVAFWALRPPASPAASAASLDRAGPP